MYCAEEGGRKRLVVIYFVVSTADPLDFGRIPKEVASTKAVEYRIGCAAAQIEPRGVADKRRLWQTR